MKSKISEIIDIITYLIMIGAIFYIGFAIQFPDQFMKISKYKSYVVVSDSMSPTIEPMSVIVVDKRPDRDYIVNDIITFQHDINRDGQIEIITHRVAKIKNANGTSYKTSPDSKDQLDPWLIPKRNVVGVVVQIIPKVGIVILGLQKVALPLLIIFDLIILLLLAQALLRWEE